VTSPKTVLQALSREKLSEYDQIVIQNLKMRRNRYKQFRWFTNVTPTCMVVR